MDSTFKAADANQLTWRQAMADDASLLFDIFAANKALDFAPLSLPEQQLRPLLEMQFRARQLSYGHNYPNALDTILCLEDGTPVGRHLVDRQADCYRTIDIAVLPQFQNRGIGAWALRQFQQLSEIESIPFRLSVLQTNPALRLYERLGFRKVSNDDVSFEMEWQPSRTRKAEPKPEVQAKPEPLVVLSNGDQLERSEVLDKIFAFLREIGLNVHLGAVPNSFLPGIQLVSGGLRVDLETLLYPGDLLHEAGHLAVMPPDRRHSEQPTSTTDGGEEMAAICWSYAAASHLNLSPEVVFHEHGYKGRARDLIKGFAQNNCPGLPLLAWMGLTTPQTHQQASIFPQMLRWLREADQPTASETSTASDDRLELTHH